MNQKAETRHWLTDRPVANLVVFMALVVFGFFSLRQLPIELMPELTYPTLTVRTEYPGTAPQEVENEISRPLEEALGVVPGLKRIKSISRSGVSDVVMEFLWGTNMDKATQEAIEKMDRVFLPREAESPLVLHFDPSLDPIMELSLAGIGNRFDGEAGLRRLRRIGELQVKRELERIDGVAAVRVRGGLEEEFHVLLDRESIERTSLSIQQVIDKLRAENINMPGGLIKDGSSEYMIRALNEFESIDSISDTVVFREGNREVRVKDIGEVKRTHREKELITRTDGNESVQIDIYKEADANIVAVAESIKNAVGEISNLKNKKKRKKYDQKKNPFGAKPKLSRILMENESASLKITADRSVFIKNSINEVRNTALIGGTLAILILIIFLKDAKSTAIIGASIPISIIMTFAPMNLSGVTLNIMSLGGLAMGIGMLVDSSIVVLESIFRCREEGDSTKKASIRGASEVRGAVVASTLTSIAVFFPMVFVEGLAGQAFFDLGLAVVFSLTASLLVAVFFIPMLASRTGLTNLSATSFPKFEFLRCYALDAFKESCHDNKPPLRYLLMPYFVLRLILAISLEVVGKIVLGVFFLILIGLKKLVRGIAISMKWLLHFPLQASSFVISIGSRIYESILDRCLKTAYLVIPFLVVCMIGMSTLISQLNSELLPEIHQGEITFEMSLPIGTPIEITDKVMKEIESAVNENRRQIKSLIVSVGYDVTNMQRSDEGEHTSKFKFLLTRSSNPKDVEDSVIGRMRKILFTVPDLDFRVVRPVLFSSQTPIEVEIFGNDLRKLKSQADLATTELNKLEELNDIESLLKSGAPEIQIIYDRDQIARFGLNVQAVASQIRAMVQGSESTKYNLKDRRIPIIVRLKEEDRSNIEDVENITVSMMGSEPIKISSLASIQQGEGPSEIRRIDGTRTAVIQANLGAGSLSQAAAAIDQSLSQNLQWPDGMGFLITGQNQEWQESQKSLFLALGLSLFLVYVIMAAQFESLAQPLLIMFTIPLAFLGTFLGLYLFGIPLSVVVMLGMIMLAGIVVNNAIVLVDYSNQLIMRGMPVGEAIRMSSSVRFRPILMTTLTTILGLLPMVLISGDGAEIRTPMAFAVITGLVTSTLLTLLIIPTLYYLLAKVIPPSSLTKEPS